MLDGAAAISRGGIMRWENKNRLGASTPGSEQLSNERGVSRTAKKGSSSCVNGTLHAHYITCTLHNEPHLRAVISFTSQYKSDTTDTVLATRFAPSRLLEPATEQHKNHSVKLLLEQLATFHRDSIILTKRGRTHNLVNPSIIYT